MDIAEKFWKKWANSIDRIKAANKIAQIIERNIKEINTINLPEKQKQRMKTGMINSYFEDLYGMYGKE